MFDLMGYRWQAALVASEYKAGRGQHAWSSSVPPTTRPRGPATGREASLTATLRRWLRLPRRVGDRSSRRLGLSVRALGALEVLIDGSVVRSWGGDHAGSLQAQAFFAQLLDRGERGATKDEIIDLLWPETDLAVADLRFHRTLFGLRRVLDPRHPLAAIRFRAGRYRLAQDLVIVSDVSTFETLLGRATLATDLDERERLIEEAVRLYRGDYLDDCPYYGDSAAVEERRAALRTLYLLAVGELVKVHRNVTDPSRSATGW